MEPIYRCGTRKAIDELAKELNLPNDLTMQDWPYEVSDPNNINEYIAHYELTQDEDKKFVLMEMILQALIDQPNKELTLSCWNKIKSILAFNFKLHEFTIYYWANLNESNFKNYKVISPLLKTLFNDEGIIS